MLERLKMKDYWCFYFTNRNAFIYVLKVNILIHYKLVNIRKKTDYVYWCNWLVRGIVCMISCAKSLINFIHIYYVFIDNPNVLTDLYK